MSFKKVRIELLPAGTDPWIDLESFDFRREIEAQQALYVLCQLYSLRGGCLRVAVGERDWAAGPAEMTTLLRNAPEILRRIQGEKVTELAFVDPGFGISFLADPVDGLSMCLMSTGERVALEATPKVFASMIFRVVEVFHRDVQMVSPRLARSTVIRSWYRECLDARDSRATPDRSGGSGGAP